MEVHRRDLEELRVFFGDGAMPWRQVNEVARADCLLAERILDAQTSFEDITPVRSLSAVVWQAREQRREISARRDRNHPDAHLAPVDASNRREARFQQDWQLILGSSHLPLLQLFPIGAEDKYGP